MKLWFRKQNTEAAASEKAEGPVTPVEQLAEAAPSTLSGGTPAASVPAAAPAQELWDEPVGLLIPGINPQIFAKMKSSLHGNRRVLISARCHRKDGSTFHGEVGAGLINLTGENLVLTIRNIEKRAPVKAIVRPNNS